MRSLESVLLFVRGLARVMEYLFGRRGRWFKGLFFFRFLDSFGVVGVFYCSRWYGEWVRVVQGAMKFKGRVFSQFVAGRLGVRRCGRGGYFMDCVPRVLLRKGFRHNFFGLSMWRLLRGVVGKSFFVRVGLVSLSRQFLREESSDIRYGGRRLFGKVQHRRYFFWEGYQLRCFRFFHFFGVKPSKVDVPELLPFVESEEYLLKRKLRRKRKLRASRRVHKAVSFLKFMQGLFVRGGMRFFLWKWVQFFFRSYREGWFSKGRPGLVAEVGGVFNQDFLLPFRLKVGLRKVWGGRNRVQQVPFLLSQERLRCSFFLDAVRGRGERNFLARYVGELMDFFKGKGRTLEIRSSFVGEFSKLKKRR